MNSLVCRSNNILSFTTVAMSGISVQVTLNGGDNCLATITCNDAIPKCDSGGDGTGDSCAIVDESCHVPSSRDCVGPVLLEVDSSMCPANS